MHDREAVRLLRLPKRLEGDGPPDRDALSLDAFRENVDADGVFGEAELLTLYQQAHADPARSRQALRETRLRARRFAALRRLEDAIAEPPASSHAVEGWLDPASAARLRSVGVVTLAQLVDMINAYGHRWYRQVPRVGPRAATRIVRWLAAHADSLTPPVQERALAPIRQQARASLMAARLSLSQLAPMDALRLPSAMSGADGLNRAPHGRNLSGAGHDLAAIEAWLCVRPSGSHTWRSYRTQAERIVLWSVFERGKPLSSLDGADLRAYQVFLSDLPAHWRGKRAAPRWSADWRPFAGPLAPASRATALGVLRALFQWLVEQGYLKENPTLAAIERPPPAKKTPRVLTRAQWAAVVDHVQNRLDGMACARANFMLALAYATGMRLAEMASATLGELKPGLIDDAEDSAWVLEVPGKAGRTGKMRAVRLHTGVIGALRRYLAVRGLPANPLECAAGTPLIGRLSATGGPALGAAALAAAFKKLFADAARHLAPRDARAARHLAEASAHWLRHAHGTHAIEAGMPREVVQENLGHASAATPAMYATSTLR
nr:phage integrase family protein [Robbsia betulipollinis]